MKTAQNLLMANGLWRIVIASILVAVFYLLFAVFSPANAQRQSTNENSYNSYSVTNAYNTNPDVELNVHNGVQILMIEFLSAVTCQLGGVDPISENGKCLGVDPKTGKIGFVEDGGGAIAVIGSLIDATFVPPASSIQYVAYLKNNFGVVKSANAQGLPSPNPCLSNVRGVGFCGLEPLLPLWTTMRNIVYLIFILVFVVIGMGIMLRVHIDPRTVMTLQNQIPKIIVGIVAITFSFAIAGFLIDIMWVTIYLFASVIQTATAGQLSAQTMINITHANSPFDAMNIAYPGGIIDLASGVSAAFGDIVTDAFNGTISSQIGAVSDIMGGIAHVIAFVVVLIAIIVVLLRLLITLIITYINVILDVIFAPFWILAGLVPGGPLGLGAWLRDLIANLAVFPVAISFFLLGSYLVKVFGDNTGGISNQLTPPLMGSVNPSAMAAIIGFGFILMLPNVLSTVKAALKTPKVNFGPIMGPIGVGTRIGGNVTRGGIDEYARSRTNQQTGRSSLGARILYTTGIAKRVR